MECDPRPGRRLRVCCALQRCGESFALGGHHLSDVAGQRTDARPPRGVVRIILQQASVLGHHRSAGACGDHHRLGARLDVRPQRVHVAPHLLQRLPVGGQMMAERAAAAGAGYRNAGDSHTIQHPRGGRVDGGPHSRLHAPRQQQHPPRAMRCGPGCAPRARRVRRGHRRRQVPRQQRARDARHIQQRAHPAGVRHDLAQQVALEERGRGAGHALFGDRAPDVQQSSVLHARRTGSLAGAAGQTAVQVQLRARGDGCTLQQLLHQVDAAARAVELIPEQLVGGTGRETETAVHAGAQNRLRLAPLRGVPDEIRERGPHDFPAVAPVSACRQL